MVDNSNSAIFVDEMAEYFTSAARTAEILHTFSCSITVDLTSKIENPFLS